MKKITEANRNGYETTRRRAIERIEKLANQLGVYSLPLDVVASMMPVCPEWLPFINRRKR